MPVVMDDAIGWSPTLRSPEIRYAYVDAHALCPGVISTVSGTVPLTVAARLRGCGDNHRAYQPY
jgi:hypothetical protein